MIDEAVVLAAGEGRRLRPVSERYAKAVLPIDGRPVIATLLRELAEAGIRRVTLVTGHLADQVEALVGDGSAWRLQLTYAQQPSADGSADAVLRALDAGARLPCIVVAADTVFEPGDIERFASAASRPAVAVRRDPPPAPPHRWAVQTRDGRVTRILDDDPANPLAGAPLWLVTAEVAARFCEDDLPYELSNAYQAAIDGGGDVSAVEIGKTRDLTYPVDLVKENFPYLAVAP